MTVLDLETVAAPDITPGEVTAPANYKDPVKIAEFIAEAQRKQIEKAALFPYTARIVALGTWRLGEPEPIAEIVRTEDEERTKLVDFWDRHRDHQGLCEPFITFCGRRFDLPVLLARSQLLGVPCPDYRDLVGYRAPHIDLEEILTCGGKVDGRKLAWYARRFGIPVEDETSGADVALLIANHQWTAVADHCLSDVRMTRALASRLGIR